MLISIVLIERTVPGFHNLIDTISRTFKAQITTALIDFPMTRSFRSARKQYDGEFLLKELWPYASESDVKLFIFREDIFAGHLNFVFGFSADDTCVVSTARLDPRFYGETDMAAAGALFKERLAKEAIHEIGHSLGMKHCKDSKCVMVFSPSVKEVDFKDPDFCAECRKELGLKKRSDR